MSEQPGPPFGPDELRRLEAMVRDANGGGPDMMGAAIDTMAGVHARWYWAWQASGVPEQRASEWAEAMISALFRTGP